MKALLLKTQSSTTPWQKHHLCHVLRAVTRIPRDARVLARRQQSLLDGLRPPAVPSPSPAGLEVKAQSAQSSADLSRGFPDRECSATEEVLASPQGSQLHGNVRLQFAQTLSRMPAPSWSGFEEGAWRRLVPSRSTKGKGYTTDIWYGDSGATRIIKKAFSGEGDR